MEPFIGPETLLSYQKRMRRECEAKFPHNCSLISGYPDFLKHTAQYSQEWSAAWERYRAWESSLNSYYDTFLEYAAWELKERPLGYARRIFERARVFERADEGAKFRQLVGEFFTEDTCEELCLASVKAEMENPEGVDPTHLLGAFCCKNKTSHIKYVQSVFKSWEYARTQNPKIFDDAFNAFIEFERQSNRIRCTHIFEALATGKDPNTNEGKEIWRKWAKFEEENMIRPWDEMLHQHQLGPSGSFWL